MAKKKKKSKRMIGAGTAAAAIAGILGLHFLEKKIGRPVNFLSRGKNNVVPPSHMGMGMGQGTWGHPGTPSMFSPTGMRPKHPYWG